MNAHLKALGAVVLALLLMTLGWSVWTSLRPQKASPAATRGLEHLPQFKVEDLAGRVISSEDYAGKVLIVNFWASWCGPCVEEIPSFVRLKRALGDDIHILAISNDNTREDIDIFLKSFPDFKGPGIEIVQDTPKDFPITKMFGVYRLPESFVFTKSGRMIRKVVGTIDWASPDAQDFLKTLIAQDETMGGVNSAEEAPASN
ncbi:MAG TPA: TlpA disulfide reductase family protein [Pseudobdellovibrionaceae bacterium]|nr:TlpA disulfide reductase family protein [Pseudobdellovibrionaceae bacterium]